ncbi:MAG: SBBP repeat-containing protein [Promethearchaeia archaeon]
MGGLSSDEGKNIAIDTADNIYIAGGTESFATGSSSGSRDCILLKYENSGVREWNRTWGAEEYDYGWGVAFDGSDNLYITGVTESFGEGNSDAFLAKYDTSGNFLWSTPALAQNEGDGEEELNPDDGESDDSGLLLWVIRCVVGRIISASAGIVVKKIYARRNKQKETHEVTNG